MLVSEALAEKLLDSPYHALGRKYIFEKTFLKKATSKTQRNPNHSVSTPAP